MKRKLLPLVLSVLAVVAALPAQEVDLTEYVTVVTENRLKAQRTRAKAEAIRARLVTLDPRASLSDALTAAQLLTIAQRHEEAARSSWYAAASQGKEDASNWDLAIRECQSIITALDSHLRKAQTRYFAALRFPPDSRLDLQSEEYDLDQLAAAYEGLAANAERLVERARINARGEAIKTLAKEPAASPSTGKTSGQGSHELEVLPEVRNHK